MTWENNKSNCNFLKIVYIIYFKVHYFGTISLLLPHSFQMNCITVGVYYEILPFNCCNDTTLVKELILSFT
jgi:hypothetical protein